MADINLLLLTHATEDLSLPEKQNIIDWFEDMRGTVMYGTPIQQNKYKISGSMFEMKRSSSHYRDRS